ncbi:MAG: MBL fold metallo-hydrolase [Candidatus Abyssobacteria bacterium SURF_5]|uniref:MBL fold metallo-hydrolase n=1 Tax=Abyssobacteria bacterium (strain SURF_5) TaxID=2093360 RepID=A0A3A4NA51_ABYX5|nr:MAG: MBL fold metallo-hydrolase [Candidatus Abyssubacteria bacterium SURF_5]
MTPPNSVTLLWHGAAHYHIIYNNTRIVIDPLYTRLPGDTPHLPVTRDDVEKIDCLLLTHGHLDHSKDFPYLAAKHNPLTYAPAACLSKIHHLPLKSGLPYSAAGISTASGPEGGPTQTPFKISSPAPASAEPEDRIAYPGSPSLPLSERGTERLSYNGLAPMTERYRQVRVTRHSCESRNPGSGKRRQISITGQPPEGDLGLPATGSLHALEQVKGKSFDIAGISITPYQIGTEEIDFWFIREMFIRPWKHRKPAALADGFRWLARNLFGNCFAFLFSFPPNGGTMLYFGNLTSEVDELDSIERVDVLAIPFCPANNHWLRDTQFLINRFRPAVALIHHFDNFMNPFTLYRYMNLDDYRSAVRRKCPETRLYFSKFYKEVELSEIAAIRTASEG